MLRIHPGQVVLLHQIFPQICIQLVVAVTGHVTVHGILLLQTAVHIDADLHHMSCKAVVLIGGIYVMVHCILHKAAVHLGKFMQQYMAYNIWQQCPWQNSHGSTQQRSK